MSRIVSTVAATSLFVLSVTTAFAQSVPVMAQRGSGVSSMTSSTVKVERHAKNDNDPLTKYGAGFYVVVFNKADQPISFGPDSVTIKDRRGNIMPLLTDDRIAQIKQNEAESSQMFGAFLGVGLAMLGGVAAARTPNPVAATDIAVTGAVVGQAVAQNGERQADIITNETGVLQAAYGANPLVDGSIAPLNAVSGRVLVEKMKDQDPAAVIVTVGGEVHEIDFK